MKEVVILGFPNIDIEFSLICSCGYKIYGAFFRGDKDEKINCPCGLIWKINRPKHFKE